MILKKEDETNETLFVWCYLWTSACKDRWVRRARKDRQMWGGEHRGWWKESVIEGRGGGFLSGVLMVSLSPQRLAQMSGQLWSDLHPACCLYPPSVCLSVCVLDYFHPKPHQKYQNIFCLYENVFLSFLCLRLRLWCSLRLLFRADGIMKANINVLKLTKIPA